jgi:hypothetical protein
MCGPALPWLSANPRGTALQGQVAGTTWHTPMHGHRPFHAAYAPACIVMASPANTQLMWVAGPALKRRTA